MHVLFIELVLVVFFALAASFLVHGAVAYFSQRYDQESAVFVPWRLMLPIVGSFLSKEVDPRIKKEVNTRKAVEGAAVIVFVLLFVRYGFSLEWMFAVFFVTILLTATVVDIKYMLVPDVLTGVIVIAGALYLLTPASWSTASLDVTWLCHLIGLGAGMGLLLVMMLSEKLTGRACMGGGDLKLVAGAGLLLGWQLLAMGFILAFIGGLIFVIATGRLKDFGKKRRVSFAPMLAFGFTFAMILGIQFLEWYFALFY